MKLLFLAVLPLLAEKNDHPTGSRITPPTISVIAPVGLARGATTEVTVEGFNLASATAIYFSEPGVKGRILRVKELPDLAETRLGSNGTVSTVDLGPLPPRNQVTVEVEVAPEAAAGVMKFRLLTPLGTSPEATMLVEPYFGEAADAEPNNSPETAFDTYLPAILAGAISRPGDQDYFKIQAAAGEELVFENGAMATGSTLSPVVAILDAGSAVIREFGYNDPAEAASFSHKFEKAGTYYVRIGDYQQSGRASHTYRYKLGRYELAKTAYPLGLRRGETREVAVTGYRLAQAKVAVKGEPSPLDEHAAVIRPGKSLHELKLALGEEPEVEAASTETLTLPVTINGRLTAAGKTQQFRFHAVKDEKIVFEVAARRLGSELDSEIEVLDANRKPVERAVARGISETYTVLRDHDSASRGIRIQAWNALAVGDYLMAGTEVMRIESLPRGPDDDAVMDSFGGQRISYFGTTGEAHAIDQPVYKVQMHPPGAKFTANGMPVARLYYRNDDGGPGYGKDSYLQFTAPADGDYYLRIRDVRGEGSPAHSYRLTARAPRPDFRLSADPRNPNVPAGGSIPLTVTAFRMDGFDGPIELSVEGLPPGLRAAKGTLGKGQVFATLLLSADENAKLENAAPFRIVGRAGSIAHEADTGDKMRMVALMPKPDVSVAAETREVVLQPGGTAEVTVTIARQRDFGGRVPVEVRNLPPRVRVLDVGLNGVLFNEDETKRTFTIEALPSAEPVEQWIYISGRVETRSPQQSSYAAPQAIRLIVKPRS